MSEQILPHGGQLVDLLVDAERAEVLRQSSIDLPSVMLTQRQTCDLELLISGGYSPLTGFMNRASYHAVLETCRLPSGELWPIPIVLDVSKTVAEKLEPGDFVALRDEEGFMVAVLTADEIWKVEKETEAEKVYGTVSKSHAGVKYLYDKINDYYVGGSVAGLQLPAHHEFEQLWNTPEELRYQFIKTGWRKVLAFQTSKPMHRLHRDLIVDVAKQQQAHVLLHPTVGMTKPGDLHYFARVHCYQELMRYFPHHLLSLSLLPLAMRMAGPREALWHGLVHQNYGCTHYIVGPDDDSPPNADNGGYYEPYAAQEFVQQYSEELLIKPVMLERHAYVPAIDRFMPISVIDKEHHETAELSDTEFKRKLYYDEPVPQWYSYPEVVAQLKKVYPPRHQQGFTIFFTGLSGSGKSTLAKIIYAKLIEQGSRPVTLLDGDIVRQNLSSELGFSKAHRDLNIRRIGFVANEITKNGGVAICAPIAPYTATRRAVRTLVEEGGAFIETYVCTPLDVCEARDRKGLYAKARKGIIPEFTGISDPYEEPEHAELNIDTSDGSPMEAAQEIFLYLFREGYLDTAA